MKSILSKLWFTITCLVLAILLIIWLFQVGLLNQFYINERKSALIEEANRLASQFEAFDDPTIDQELVEEIQSFTSSRNARILILDRQENVLFLNAGDRFFRNNRDLDPDHNRPLPFPRYDSTVKESINEGKAVFVHKKNSRMNERLLIVGVPVFQQKEIIGSIIITSPVAPIEETISILKKQLSYISVFSLGIGTLLALFLARFFTKPIVNIIEVSQKIAQGDFTASVTEKSDDEIGVLGETINDMAQQLNKIEQLRKDFIANISHELKTPISLIKAYAELVKEVDHLDIKDKEQYLEVIMDESDRLNNMIEDILYLSKIEAGYSNLVFDTFSLKEVLDGVIEKLDYFSSNKNIGFTIDKEYTAVQIYGDKDKIYQVFYNIINNAITHSHQHAQIMIRVLCFEKTIRIEVIDHGKGIPPEDLPFIWDRFYKVDKSRQRDDSGTGLGMAIVKNILEAHGYEYGIKSEINKGTMVWIEASKGR